MCLKDATRQNDGYLRALKARPLPPVVVRLDPRSSSQPPRFIRSCQVVFSGYSTQGPIIQSPNHPIIQSSRHETRDTAPQRFPSRFHREVCTHATTARSAPVHRSLPPLCVLLHSGHRAFCARLHPFVTVTRLCPVKCNSNFWVVAPNLHSFRKRGVVSAAYPKVKRSSWFICPLVCDPG